MDTPSSPLMLSFAEYDAVLAQVGASLLTLGFTSTYTNGFSRDGVTVLVEHLVPEDGMCEVALVRGQLALFATDGVSEVRRKVLFPHADLTHMALKLVEALRVFLS